MQLSLEDFVPRIIFKLYYKIFPNHMPENISECSRHPPFNYLPPGINVKWVMDIGANEGSVAISALSSFKDANIVCFEPVFDTYIQLEKNLDPFKSKVTLFRKAVSRYTGECEINLTTFNPANSIVQQSEFYNYYNPSIKSIGKEKIDVINLDDFSQHLPSGFFDIVKIDVEGLELDVLEGGKKFFENCVDFIMIEISFQRDVNWNHQNYLKIFNCLDSLGYRLINIYDVYNTTCRHGGIFQDMMVTQIDCVFRKK